MTDPSTALARARAAALEELRRRPTAVSWRRQAAWVVAALVGTCLLAMAAALAGSLADGPRLLAQAPWLAALLVVGAAAGVAAI
ncbi:MAG TPA: DUF1109 domain-containing protein, partial [Polyangia bacterium]|nr:DUF1109 domain-containing protein [Polyangia bacterium]